MLKQRVITGIFVACVVAGILFFTPALVFILFVSAVVAVATWEWSNLSSIKFLPFRLLYLCAMLGAGMAVWFWQSRVGELPLVGILSIAGAWWAVALLWVQSYPASVILWRSPITRLVIGFLVIWPAWLSLVVLRDMPNGKALVAIVVLLVAAADICAYFAGRAFGKNKLAPQVSPGKSWEGVLGGVLGAMLVSVGLAFYLGSSNWIIPLLIAIPTALVSVLGDLLESMMKRHRGIKDSGRILPGHGGMLDRIDGLVAAAPVFTLAVLATGWSFPGL